MFTASFQSKRHCWALSFSSYKMLYESVCIIIKDKPFFISLVTETGSAVVIGTLLQNLHSKSARLHGEIKKISRFL